MNPPESPESPELYVAAPQTPPATYLYCGGGGGPGEDGRSATNATDRMSSELIPSGPIEVAFGEVTVVQPRSLFSVVSATARAHRTMRARRRHDPANYADQGGGGRKVQGLTRTDRPYSATRIFAQVPALIGDSH